MAVLSVESDLQLAPPAATTTEVEATPDVDVVVLVGGLGADPVDVLRQLSSPDGPAWVVLTTTPEPHLPREMPKSGHFPREMRSQGEGPAVEEVLAAGARGCLAASSTPLQIGAAIRAAARGERSDVDQPVTGPLVQRMPRTAALLTEREVEVLRLVGAGLGNREIAERLYLSLSSVKSHLSHTYGRLGVSGRDAAVAEARRQGLI